MARLLPGRPVWRLSVPGVRRSRVPRSSLLHPPTRVRACLAESGDAPRTSLGEALRCDRWDRPDRPVWLRAEFPAGQTLRLCRRDARRASETEGMAAAPVRERVLRDDGAPHPDHGREALVLRAAG